MKRRLKPGKLFCNLHNYNDFIIAFSGKSFEYRLYPQLRKLSFILFDTEYGIRDIVIALFRPPPRIRDQATSEDETQRTFNDHQGPAHGRPDGPGR